MKACLCVVGSNNSGVGVLLSSSQQVAPMTAVEADEDVVPRVCGLFLSICGLYFSRPNFFSADVCHGREMNRLRYKEY